MPRKWTEDVLRPIFKIKRVVLIIEVRFFFNTAYKIVSLIIKRRLILEKRGDSGRIPV